MMQQFEPFQRDENLRRRTKEPNRILIACFRTHTVSKVNGMRCAEILKKRFVRLI